ncbi:protein phosphatase 2C domain-containing protein [Massilia sp. W12]|uniref:PP2C family protein-serine/threonine phosphatase n=1 Tax=Massilia sp. W12 TaxID=3126507 RepID=UPI0030CE63F9
MSQYKITYKIEAGTAQHIGNRPEQLDRTGLFTSATAPGYLLAVLADGMSGHAGGKLAADQALLTARSLFEAWNPERVKIRELLESMVDEAHTMIKLNRISLRPEGESQSEPHSTFVVLLVTPQGQAYWLHIGDSRIYCFHGKQCTERSNDEAYIEALCADGRISREAAKNHRRSALLMNALGNTLKNPFITYGKNEALQAGDAFLLCSDGLWRHFADNELAAAVALKSPRQAAEMLIEKAQERAKGNGDNCTMAIVKLVKLSDTELGYKVEKLTRAV